MGSDVFVGEHIGLSTPARLEDLVSDQASRTPQALALLHRGREFTYAELEERANQLAQHLAAMGVGPGELVGVCMRRTPEMIVTLLAVLKTGAAYLPLDPNYPLERLDFMLGDSAASVLVTDDQPWRELSFHGTVVDILEEAAVIALRPKAPPLFNREAADLAYVIYTSGSTGAPKGVLLGHTAVGLVDWARETFTDGQLARVAATTSICFDPSIFEIFAPLCSGGAVILKENALEPFAPDERPTLIQGVPSALAELCRAGAVPESVRVINIGGEPLSAALVREVYARTRAEAVYNHYGPTETTITATVALVSRDVAEDPPIGRPVAGARIVLLDSAGRPAAPGAVGEIHIGGPGLALGYLNRPELTAERFVAVGADWLYRTGDLGVWTASGELRFVGRVDTQVKIRGFRVELGEVEAALMQLPAVEAAACQLRTDDAGRPQFVAYVQSQAALTLREVRAGLSAWLPEHMLPARLVVLERFPLTLSGKVDRNALPAPTNGSQPAAAIESRIEEAIAEVFKEILGLRELGPEDSFFEVGGDSLRGVAAALRLEEVLGYEIPSALIHQAPTPRALSRALEHCPPSQAQHLSVLAPGAEAAADAPLFCVADLFGRPFSYLSLARRLAGPRAIYGLSPGPLEARLAETGDIAALTRGYVSEMRRIQPRGPYQVAGYSAAGVLAFDLARALEQEGETVRLMLLDCPMRSERPPRRLLARWMLRQARDLLDLRRAPLRLARLAHLRRKLVHSLAVATPKSAPEWIPPRQAALAATLMRVCAAYRPQAFEGPALVVKCADRDRVDALLDHDGVLGWSRPLRGPVACVWVDGDHHGFMREPRVAGVAEAVAAFLERGRS